MLCMWFVLAPRQQVRQVEPPPAPGQSAPRREFGREGLDQRQPRGRPAGPLDFQSDPQRVTTRPPGQAEVVPGAAGGAIIRWRPSWQPEQPAVLLLPLQPALKHVSQLVLRLRADREQRLQIQVLDAEGTAFQVERSVPAVWAEITIPLADFKLNPVESDQRQQLKPKRITAVGLVQPPTIDSQRSGEQALAVIEIQSCRLE